MAISFGATGTDDASVLKGRIPIHSTFQQYIPVIDEDTGGRLTLSGYNFELTFRERDTDTVVLRLTTVGSDGITKTTDSVGDILLVQADPTDMANLDGAYRCSFSSTGVSDDVITLLASGLVVFTDDPATWA
jgi:hypothetical protein